MDAAASTGTLLPNLNVMTKLYFLSTTLPWSVLGLYLGIISALTFAVYARDKAAAMRCQWRTRESTLHLLSLAGGWPGALAAQKMFHHKSRKSGFRAIFWLTVALNCAGLVLFLTFNHPLSL